jgi:hypothetical protein
VTLIRQGLFTIGAWFGAKNSALKGSGSGFAVVVAHVVVVAWEPLFPPHAATVITNTIAAAAANAHRPNESLVIDANRISTEPTSHDHLATRSRSAAGRAGFELKR